MENRNPITPNNFLKTFKILHLALLIGMLFFGVVVYMQNDSWELTFFDAEDVFLYLSPVLAIGGIVVGNIIFKKFIEKARLQPTLNLQLQGFQSASVIKYSLVEGPALFSLVSAMISSNLFFFIIAGVLSGYLFSLRPTKDKIVNQLKLNHEMKTRFNSGDQTLD